MNKQRKAGIKMLRENIKNAFFLCKLWEEKRDSEKTGGLAFLEFLAS